ncbi:hypothetical protein EDD16DRAFT_1612009 [Pisolithus croceorrhizus]|nr:hypothetical protein EDD16DRAFT_1612009 [Pisolithus croceorrhizus]
MSYRRHSGSGTNACDSNKLAGAMDELRRARVMLTALERQAHDLLVQFYSVRSAARAQRSKVEELVQQLPIAPIDRLPDELLSRIFELSLLATAEKLGLCHVHRLWKRELAGVSRRWKGIVLHSPSLWTYIKVTPTWGKGLLQAYVRRSAECLVDVVVDQWPRQTADVWSKRGFFALLDVVVPSAYRWRSFAISNDVGMCYVSSALERLDHLRFPSLIKLMVLHRPRGGTIIGEEQLLDPLRHDRFPSLKYLQFEGRFINSPTLRIPPSVVLPSIN